MRGALKGKKTIIYAMRLFLFIEIANLEQENEAYLKLVVAAHVLAGLCKALHCGLEMFV
jgi:hypothetical protein